MVKIQKMVLLTVTWAAKITCQNSPNYGIGFKIVSCFFFFCSTVFIFLICFLVWVTSATHTHSSWAARPTPGFLSSSSFKSSKASYCRINPRSIIYIPTPFRGLWVSLTRLQPLPPPAPDPAGLALLTEVRKKADGSKSEVSQEDTASEAEVNTEEPLNGDEGEEEGLARDECEDELVRAVGCYVPPARGVQ